MNSSSHRLLSGCCVRVSDRKRPLQFFFGRKQRILIVWDTCRFAARRSSTSPQCSVRTRPLRRDSMERASRLAAKQAAAASVDGNVLVGVSWRDQIGAIENFVSHSRNFAAISMLVGR